MIRCTTGISLGACAWLSLAMALVISGAAAADFGSIVTVRADFDASARTATFQLTNGGNQAIIGGEVRVSFQYSDGSDTTSHLQFDLLPSVGLENKLRAGDPPMQIGALQTGQTYRVLQTVSAQANGSVPVGAGAGVDALVFMDNTAIGDSQYIDELFEQWRDETTTYTSWHKKADQLLGPGAGTAALRELSDDAKTMMAAHPATEPRVRYQIPVTEEERLTRHSPALEEISSLIDGVCTGVDAHTTSEAEGISFVREYLRIRTETTTAHLYRRGGN